MNRARFRLKTSTQSLTNKVIIGGLSGRVLVLGFFLYPVGNVFQKFYSPCLNNDLPTQVYFQWYVDSAAGECYNTEVQTDRHKHILEPNILSNYTSICNLKVVY